MYSLETRIGVLSLHSFATECKKQHFLQTQSKFWNHITIPLNASFLQTLPVCKPHQQIHRSPR